MCERLTSFAKDNGLKTKTKLARGVYTTAVGNECFFFTDYNQLQEEFEDYIDSNQPWHVIRVLGGYILVSEKWVRKASPLKTSTHEQLECLVLIVT